MSSHSIIQDISRELRRRIHQALADTPDTDFGLSTPEQDISLSPPAPPSNTPPLLSVYLYHIEPDANLRNQPKLSSGPNALRFPPLALQLHYMITALNEDEDRNHLVLGRVLQHFHDEPFLGQIGNAPLGDSFGGASPEVRVTLENLTLEELSRVWTALQSGYQLSVAYRVQVVAVDSALPEVDARRVQEIDTAVGTLQ